MRRVRTVVAFDYVLDDDSVDPDAFDHLKIDDAVEAWRYPSADDRFDILNFEVTES